MDNQQQNSLMNDVLVSVHRSLLQYLGECSPWVSPEETTILGQTQELIDFQHSAVTHLEELLELRREHVDFGLYPTEYTDMQFLSLSYLLKEALTEAKTIEQTISQAVTSASNDVEAAGRIKQVQNVQQEVIVNLEQLISTQKAQQNA